MKREELKNLIEATVFISNSPVRPEQLFKYLNEKTNIETIREILKELKNEYKDENRGFYLREVAKGYQFVTKPEFNEFLQDYYKKDARGRLSRASLEVLAIVAYKQPITRSEIENIRGVDSGSSLKNLLDKKLIRIIGRADTPGRPLLYKTTSNFLEVFGLKDINELPEVEGQEMLFEGYGEDEDK